MYHVPNESYLQPLAFYKANNCIAHMEIKLSIKGEHLVNNSLRPGQHKRLSFDHTLYSQIHKKILRKTVIERRYQDSIHSLSLAQNPPQSTTNRGFRGKTLPNFRQARSLPKRSSASDIRIENNERMHTSSFDNVMTSAIE